MILAGRVLCRGDVIDSTEFALDQRKWAQLIDGRFVDLLDKPGVPVVVTGSRDEIAAVIAGEAEVESITANPLACQVAGCTFVANAPNGLKVHASRKHKE